MGAHSYAGYSGPRHARPRGPRHARPAPPTAAYRSLAVGGVTAALVAGESLAMAGPAAAVTADTWAALRMCESSGNYQINTGNGYYGAYQFNLATWHGLGYSGLPSAAAPAVQDQAAQRLYAQRGWQPWPACSARLGLVDDRQASRGSQRPPLAASPSPAPSAPPAPAPPAKTAAPTTTKAGSGTQQSSPTDVSTSGGWDGHYLSVRDVGQVRADVRVWQSQMVADGYPLAVDGQYGPQSAAAATRFEQAHGLHVENPGIVGPQVWGALFGK